MSLPALQLDRVTKEFRQGWRDRRFRAVDQLSLQVEQGEVFGLLGPNGCGKSTTIKLLAGLMRPSAGVCRVGGHPADSLEARRRVGYLPEPGKFHGHLNGEELVWFHARLSGLGRSERARAVETALGLVGLGAAARQRVAHYSTGMLRRIGLAQALVHNPGVLILDEPTAGVDPRGMEEIVAVIRRVKAAGKTVLLTSHLLGQVEDVCDRVALLDRGRLVLERRVRDLLQHDEREAWVIDRLAPAEQETLRAWLAEKGRRLHAVETPRPRLEHVFATKAAVGETAAPAERVL
jgi:ABC-2 type transport system ATP-binding protein